jgi:tyrosine-specific transport protein
MSNLPRLLGAILLVSGTTIGAGMLALPIVTGFAGFIPATLLFILYWIFMTFTALLMLEVNLWMGENTNLITMAKNTLGNGGKICSWVIYLFLLYSLTTAYIAGSGPIFIDFTHQLTGYTMPPWFGPFPLLLLFGFFVYQGARAVDYANRFLMFGLALTFILMTLFLTPEVQPALLKHMDWSALWIAVSIVSTSFGFHIIIPTLTDYLKRDAAQLRTVILVGSVAPLVIYILWNFLALGIIPLDELTKGYAEGLDGATLLSQLLGRSDLALVASFFSLFAIVTSFLGVSLSLRDFLADGLNISKTHQGRALLYVLTFAPPLALALTDPRAFLHALEYAGAFGVVTLLAILPIMMVWKGRYSQHREGPYQAPGGKWALVVAMIISLSVIGIEIANKTGYLYTQGSF